jgi:light-regulated signal transduction histidine kinase (bacteriophytochrome)
MSTDDYNHLSPEACRKKLKSLAEDFELVAHIASHDLRDPLRQALYNLEQISEKQGDETALMAEATDSINLVLNKIGLLREYSHIVNSPFEREEIDLSQLIDETIEQHKTLIDQTSAMLHIPKLPTIEGTRHHIGLLFSHLIENALRFRGKENPQISLSCEDKDTHWQLTLTDNGIGLDPIYQQIVFSLFQKLEPEKHLDHMGVGLAFCHKIIENHGGHFHFTSDGENGTSFIFTLPK